TVRLQPTYNFQMSGLGYGHPRWTHGAWLGEAVVGGERITLPITDPLTRESVHVQSLCQATCTAPDGTVSTGTGILEQLCIGPHPSGLTGILDPATPQ
ncbi:MAG TPA: hypothetical protein PLV68_10735, partial [Ilumatobacteraceae bacterium]|nr:hypothetical protein [Ilumatobacteraceae bacterium]